MKNYLYLFLILISTSSLAQIKVAVGNNKGELVTKKQPAFSSYITDQKDFFVIENEVAYQKLNTLISIDKSGNIIRSSELTVDMGVSNNTVDVIKLAVLGEKSYIFLQNKNKATLKNLLLAKSVDGNGKVATEAVPIASMEFLKLSNGGKWYTCITPDKKHIAIIGLNPHVKEKADVLDYYILDNNLAVTTKGKFSFEGYTKELSFDNFLASDKGDFYMTSTDYDKSYIYPVLYKYTAGATPMIIPVMIADPALKNLSYKSSLNPDGDLIIAGYTQKKSSFTSGDIANNGIWLFNSAHPNEVKTFKAENAVQNIVARDIIQNGDTFYLIGEYFKKEQEKVGGSNTLSQLTDPNYSYTHGDINVTAFSSEGNKKFEIPVSRKMLVKNFDQELMIGTGVLNNKLILIYNDQYNKYFEDKYREFSHIKVPVAVLITNEGLMEAPVQFAKELNVKQNPYVLLPQFSISSNDKITVLSADGQSVTTVTFSK